MAAWLALALVSIQMQPTGPAPATCTLIRASGARLAARHILPPITLPGPTVMTFPPSTTPLELGGLTATTYVGDGGTTTSTDVYPNATSITTTSTTRNRLPIFAAHAVLQLAVPGRLQQRPWQQGDCFGLSCGHGGGSIGHLCRAGGEGVICETDDLNDIIYDSNDPKCVVGGQPDSECITTIFSECRTR